MLHDVMRMALMLIRRFDAISDAIIFMLRSFISSRHFHALMMSHYFFLPIFRVAR